MLLERLVGSEDEDLLDRLVVHPALAGPERTFLQAQLAHRRGDDEAARTLVHDSLQELPGHAGFREFADRIGDARIARLVRVADGGPVGGDRRHGRC